MAGADFHVGEWWVVELNNEERLDLRFADGETLVAFVADIAKNASGQMAAFRDAGRRPFWERLLGLSKRVSAAEFAIEWCGEFASLMFYDDAGSEYRVHDRTHPVNPPDEIRLRISHGEPVPAPAAECMNTARAWDAIQQFIQSESRPDWLSYHRVP